MGADGDISEAVDWPPGWSVRCVDATGSTNDDLLSEAERGGLADREVLVAAHQRAGRGRLDRTWEAPPGANLLASIHFAQVPTHPAEITQRVGLAIVDAVDALLGDETTPDPSGCDRSGSDGSGSDRQVGLKWPNDVVVGPAKLAGVLAQRSTTAPGVVVGFGINVGWAPPGAARLGDADGLAISTTPQALLARVLRCFDALPVDIADRYRERLTTIGRPVRIQLPGNRQVTGRATAVTADGALVVVDDHGHEQTFDVGDVVHLRPA